MLCFVLNALLLFDFDASFVVAANADWWPPHSHVWKRRSHWPRRQCSETNWVCAGSKRHACSGCCCCSRLCSCIQWLHIRKGSIDLWLVLRSSTSLALKACLCRLTLFQFVVAAAIFRFAVAVSLAPIAHRPHSEFTCLFRASWCSVQCVCVTVHSAESGHVISAPVDTQTLHSPLCGNTHFMWSDIMYGDMRLQAESRRRWRQISRSVKRGKTTHLYLGQRGHLQQRVLSAENPLHQANRAAPPPLLLLLSFCFDALSLSCHRRQCRVSGDGRHNRRRFALFIKSHFVCVFPKCEWVSVCVCVAWFVRFSFAQINFPLIFFIYFLLFSNGIAFSDNIALRAC